MWKWSLRHTNRLYKFFTFTFTITKILTGNGFILKELKLLDNVVLCILK